VTWHLAYPKLLPPPPHMLYLLRFAEFNCSVPDKEIFSVLKSAINSSSDRLAENLLYPQNTMRNLAREHCKTEWVMCPDIDMVFPDPEPNGTSMYSRLNTFLKTPETYKCEKCAFVFPLYEVENFGDRVPSSKKVLLQYLANKSAQIYHQKYFGANQRCSNLKAWEALPLKDEIKKSYEIKYKWLYEPVYIVKQGAPIFDERYVGYGMTRNTQASVIL